MDRQTTPRCKHCDEPMSRWANPEAGTWTGDFQYVCFNDGCPYFVRGWAWMNSRYAVTASYRYRVDPTTSEAGPLPVWSKSALRNGILGEEDLNAG